jgi:S-DNA-T family DNA segregation ATPase FtsK/SpoIIIE
MRRHARKMRSYGLQPMMVINSDDQLPETAAVLIFRWARRYRSELAPLFLAAATMLAAGVLHATHHGWARYIFAATTVAACGLAILGRRLGLASPAERLYAAAVVIGDGGWLGAATTAGPLRVPLPQILVAVGAVLAVPWWASHRRRARVRVERKLEAWPEIAQAVGLAGSRVMSAVVDVWGWRARFGLARGQTIADVLARLPAIESALGAVRGAARAYPTPDNLAHRFETPSSARRRKPSPHDRWLPVWLLSDFQDQKRASG